MLLLLHKEDGQLFGCGSQLSILTKEHVMQAKRSIPVHHALSIRFWMHLDHAGALEEFCSSLKGPSYFPFQKHNILYWESKTCCRVIFSLSQFTKYKPIHPPNNPTFLFRRLSFIPIFVGSWWIVVLPPNVNHCFNFDPQKWSELFVKKAHTQLRSIIQFGSATWSLSRNIFPNRLHFSWTNSGAVWNPVKIIFKYLYSWLFFWGMSPWHIFSQHKI